jgi:hypothetical protein
MNKLTHLLIGPELLWVVFYGIVLLIIKLTGSPVKSMDRFWESTTYIIPFIFVTITFLSYYLPGVIRDWLLLRIWIAGLVGGHFVLDQSLNAYSEQGPGIGTAYMVGIIFIFFVLVAGSIWAVIKF